MNPNLVNRESRSVIDRGFMRSGDVCLAKPLKTNKALIRSNVGRLARSGRVGEIPEEDDRLQ